MNKKVLVFRVAVVCLLLFSSSRNINVRAYSNLAYNYDLECLNSIYDVEEKNIVAEMPGSDIRLYFVKNDKDFGM